MPLIRRDLGLSYTEIGLLLGVPALTAGVIEPALGLLADRGHRRALVLGGGVVSSLVLIANAVATGFSFLMAAFVVGYLAAGSFVTLAQTVLMDAAPDHHERSMARWVFIGSLGVTAGPFLVVAGNLLDLGWRPVFWFLAGLGLILTFLARRLPLDTRAAPEQQKDATRFALRAMRDPAVRRWLIVIEAADLLVDVFFIFLAIYLVDVAGATSVQASLAVSLSTAGAIAGSALILPMLARVDGLRYLRVSAVVAAAAFALFLIVDALSIKVVAAAVIAMLGAGWYSIPKARLYSSLPGRSGIAVALESGAALVGSQAAVAIGAASAAFGLGNAMWLLMAAPVSILVLVRSPRSEGSPRPRSRSA